MIRPFVAIAVVLTVLAGCGSGTPAVSDEDRRGLIDELVNEVGVPRDRAECAVDGQIDAFGARIMDEEDQPSADDFDVLTEIWIGCELIPTDDDPLPE